jgi:hypothetical protein
MRGAIGGGRKVRKVRFLEVFCSRKQEKSVRMTFWRSLRSRNASKEFYSRHGKAKWTDSHGGLPLRLLACQIPQRIPSGLVLLLPSSYTLRQQPFLDLSLLVLRVAIVPRPALLQRRLPRVLLVFIRRLRWSSVLVDDGFTSACRPSRREHEPIGDGRDAGRRLGEDRGGRRRRGIGGWGRR